KLAIAIAAIGASALGAVTEAQERSAGIEQVIVQARRVEENVQEVPLAITALSGDQLERAGMQQIRDMTTTIPSVQSQSSTGRASATWFGIRGQKADSPLLTQDQAVGVYINGVASGWPYGIGTAGALDVATLEVAKGPQGTLFGKNTTGGAIIITSNEPVQDLSGRIKAGMGNYNLRELEGMINLPIVDSLALRLAAQSSKRDGVIENLSSGADFNDKDDWTARASLKWQPTDPLSSLFIFSQTESHTGGVGSKLIGFDTTKTFGPRYASAYAKQAGDGFFEARSSRAHEYQDLKTWDVSNTTTYDINESLTVKNIISYADLDYQTDTNLDAIDAWDNLFTVNGVTAPWVFASEQFSEGQQFTEELQLIGSLNRFDWIAGAYFSRLKGRDGSLSSQFTVNGRPNAWQQGPLGGFVNESTALFAQGTYALTDALNLTLGVRQTLDHREIKYSTYSLSTTTGQPTACAIRDNSGLLPLGNCLLRVDDDFSEPTWNVSLDYKIDNSQLIYIAHRHGYRSGGFPARGSDPITGAAFDPETVNDIELGYKVDSVLGDIPLRVNTAIYYQDYQDIQRSTTVIAINGQVSNTIVNAASATIQGGEIEFTLLPFDGLELTGYIAVVDAKYDEWIDRVTRADRSGERFGTLPERSGSFTARYQLPVPEEAGAIHVSGSVYAQSDVALYNDNQGNASCIQSGYSIYNARADWEEALGSAGLTLSLWGRNLGNREYFASGLCFNNTTGFTVGYPGDPRTFGLSVAYKFN
ncbi:MAG: TonB-dependent receptor, partial [Spongiibacteraceae bacterium]